MSIASSPAASPRRAHPRAPHHLSLAHQQQQQHDTTDEKQPQPAHSHAVQLPHLLHWSLDAAPREEICDLDEEDAALTPYQRFSTTVDEDYTRFLHDVNLSTAQRQAEHEYAVMQQRRERNKQIRMAREQREELQRRLAPYLHSPRSTHMQAFGSSVASAVPDLNRRQTEPVQPASAHDPSTSHRLSRPSSSPLAGSSGHSALMWSPTPTPPPDERTAETFRLPSLQRQRRKDVLSPPMHPYASTAPNSPLTSPSSSRHRRMAPPPPHSSFSRPESDASPSPPSLSPPFRPRRDSYAQQAILPSSSKSPRTVRIAKQNARRQHPLLAGSTEPQEPPSQPVPASPASPVPAAFQLNTALSLGCGSSLQPLHMSAKHGPIFTRAHSMLQECEARGWLHFGQAHPVCTLQSREELERALADPDPDRAPPSIPFSVPLQLLQWLACQTHPAPLHDQTSDTIHLLVNLLQVLAYYVCEYSEHRYSLMNMDDSLKFLLRIHKAAAMAASTPSSEGNGGADQTVTCAGASTPQVEIQISSLSIIAALVGMETHAASAHNFAPGTVALQPPHPQLPVAQLDKLENRMQRLLQQYEVQPRSLVEICLRICSRLLITHKRHEQLCSGGFVSTLLSVMDACPSAEQMQLSCVECISELLNCGRIQQRHRAELEQHGRGLRLLLAAQTAFPSNVALQGRVLNSLSVLSAEVSVKQRLLQQSILLPVVQLIRRHAHAGPFLAQSFQTLSSLVIGEPPAEEKLVSLDMVELVVAALRLHAALPSLAENALLLLRSMVLAGAKTKQQVRFMRVGGFEQLATLMRLHARSGNVVLNAWQLLLSFTGSTSGGQAAAASGARVAGAKQPAALPAAGDSELVRPIPFSTVGGDPRDSSASSLSWHSLQGMVPDLLPLAIMHLRTFEHSAARALQVAVCRAIMAIVSAFAAQRAQLPRELNPADALLQQGVLPCLLAHVERHVRSRPSLLLLCDLLPLLASTASPDVAAKTFAPVSQQGAVACKRAMATLATQVDATNAPPSSPDKLTAKVMRVAHVFAKYAS